MWVCCTAAVGDRKANKEQSQKIHKGVKSDTNLCMNVYA